MVIRLPGQNQMLKAQDIQDAHAVQPANFEARQISDGSFSIRVGAVQNNQSSFDFEFIENLRRLFRFGLFEFQSFDDPEPSFGVSESHGLAKGALTNFLRQNDFIIARLWTKNATATDK